jgi:hypothetical protein
MNTDEFVKELLISHEKVLYCFITLVNLHVQITLLYTILLMWMKRLLANS